MAHPMHLHGQTGWVVAKDGFPLPARYRAGPDGAMFGMLTALVGEKAGTGSTASGDL